MYPNWGAGTGRVKKCIAGNVLFEVFRVAQCSSCWYPFGLLESAVVAPSLTSGTGPIRVICFFFLLSWTSRWPEFAQIAHMNSASKDKMPVSFWWVLSRGLGSLPPCICEMSWAYKSVALQLCFLEQEHCSKGTEENLIEEEDIKIIRW